MRCVGASAPRFLRPDPCALQNMKSLEPRPCHRMYITGRCDNKRCNYGHTYELTESETAAIRTLAKEMLCPEHKLGRCGSPYGVIARWREEEQAEARRSTGKKTAETCMYGHVCPRGR